MAEQGSPEWFAKRCGKVTASRITDMLAKPKVPGKGLRANYLTQLAVERLTGVPSSTYQSAIMEEAHQWEPKAREWYMFRKDVSVEVIDFVDHADIPMSGCSPDGFVGAEGLVEFKCPIQATHVGYLRKGAEAIDREYQYQMQFQMSCTGRRWCDFVTYNDDMPPHRKGMIIRVPRDSVIVAEIEDAVRAFQTEINLLASWLKEE